MPPIKDEADTLAIDNDTMYSLGADAWLRDANTCYRFGRAIQAGRVWINNYHAYPAHAAFGGYKQSGIGRENHKMTLDHYQQTKNVRMGCTPDKRGGFEEELTGGSPLCVATSAPRRTSAWGERPPRI